MAATINIHEAKTQFSRLVDRAANGETVIIAKSGKPVAKLVPLDKSVVDTSKRIGGLEGKFVVPENFDRWMEDEIAEMFYGKD